MEVTENQIGELNEKEKLKMDISFVWLACVVNMVSGLSLIVLLCSFVVYTSLNLAIYLYHCWYQVSFLCTHGHT